MDAYKNGSVQVPETRAMAEKRFLLYPGQMAASSRTRARSNTLSTQYKRGKSIRLPFAHLISFDSPQSFRAVPFASFLMEQLNDMPLDVSLISWVI